MGLGTGTNCKRCKEQIYYDEEDYDLENELCGGCNRGVEGMKAYSKRYKKLKRIMAIDFKIKQVTYEDALTESIGDIEYFEVL